MNSLALALQQVGDPAAEVARDALRERVVVGCRDDELLGVLAAAARLTRAAEAILIEAAAEVEERSHDSIRSERMTSRYGCRSVGELLARTTRLSQRRASELVAAGRAVLRPTAAVSGEVLPADFPCLREALADGEVGVDAIVAIAGPLRAWPGGRGGLLAADEELAAAARGEGADAAPPRVRRRPACAGDRVGGVPRSRRSGAPRGAGHPQAWAHPRSVPRRDRPYPRGSAGRGRGAAPAADRQRAEAQGRRGCRRAELPRVRRRGSRLTADRTR